MRAGFVAAARGLSGVAHGLSYSVHVGSSQARDRTHVPCVARQIPDHWTPRGALDDIPVPSKPRCAYPLIHQRPLGLLLHLG